jgi:hypothetical protein
MYAEGLVSTEQEDLFTEKKGRCSMVPVKSPPMRGNAVPAVPQTVKAKVTFGEPVKGQGHKIIFYGTGGIGKTTLAALAPAPAFIDLDESLGKLKLNVPVVQGVRIWAELRAVLQGDGWDKIKTIVIDTGTKAEELAIAHTLLTVKTEKGGKADNVESYGYGKGFLHVYNTFMGLLMDLDRHSRSGRNVILICHECVKMVPNPRGDDYQRYEPRIQDPASGKNSIRLVLKEWADHTLFMSYDIESNNKKGKGCGTRTVWTAEFPFCMAKSRSTQEAIAVDGSDFWSQIIK